MLNPMGKGLSPAVASLGDALAEQVGNETEEERKKRMARSEQMKLLGPAAMALGLGTSGPGGLGG